MSIKSEVVAMLDFLGLDEFTRSTFPGDLRKDFIYKKSDDKLVSRSYVDDGHEDQDIDDVTSINTNFSELHATLRQLCILKARKMVADKILTDAGLDWCLE